MKPAIRPIPCDDELCRCHLGDGEASSEDETQFMAATAPGGIMVKFVICKDCPVHAVMGEMIRRGVRFSTRVTDDTIKFTQVPARPLTP